VCVCVCVCVCVYVRASHIRKHSDRFTRTTLEMYESALERLFEAPGMTGEKFRKILLQGEQVRMKVTNARGYQW